VPKVINDRVAEGALLLRQSDHDVLGGSRLFRAARAQQSISAPSVSSSGADVGAIIGKRDKGLQ
jgi:hypothetical protein